MKDYIVGRYGEPPSLPGQGPGQITTIGYPVFMRCAPPYGNGHTMNHATFVTEAEARAYAQWRNMVQQAGMEEDLANGELVVVQTDAGVETR